jgi:nucleotide-binding universal stress UspA family protein
VNDTSAEVVVGVDGSDSATAAQHAAAAVAVKLGAAVRLVHAVPDTGFVFGETTAAMRAAAMASLSANAERLLADVRSAVVAAQPDSSVSTVATAESADNALIGAGAHARLVVLGGVELRPAAAVLLGSTTLRVAAGAQCPVVAFRGTAREPSTAPIVVGLDESSSAMAALDVAMAMAASFAAPVRVVHSWTLSSIPDDVPGFPNFQELNAATQARVTAIVDAAQRRHPGAQATIVWERPGPSRALLDHSDDAQLIAVGNRGRSLLAAAMLGSTGLNLLHNSKVPVMVCDRGVRVS